MRRQLLTDRTLNALSQGKMITDAKIPGFVARRHAHGESIYLQLRYRSPIERSFNGHGFRQRVLTLGRWGRDGLDLDEAREIALLYKEAVRSGRCPATERDERKRASRGIRAVQEAFQVSA